MRNWNRKYEDKAVLGRNRQKAKSLEIKLVRSKKRLQSHRAKMPR